MKIGHQSKFHCVAFYLYRSCIRWWYDNCCWGRCINLNWSCPSDFTIVKSYFSASFCLALIHLLLEHPTLLFVLLKHRSQLRKLFFHIKIH